MLATILFVDDEPSIVDVLTRFLTREGYNVVTATNGREALERAKQYWPDIIILDVTMPEMDGFTACEKLKADGDTTDIPILLLTGLDEHKYFLQGMKAGADDYLT